MTAEFGNWRYFLRVKNNKLIGLIKLETPVDYIRNLSCILMYLYYCLIKDAKYFLLIRGIKFLYN